MTYGRFRRSKDCEWGKLFGLEPTDLTVDQLQKMELGKLIEFIPLDSRVEKLVSDRLLTVDIKDIADLNRLKTEELSDLQYFLDKYNECIRLRSDDIDGECKSRYWNNDRERYVRWHLLDDANKMEEVNRWNNGKDNIVPKEEIDYTWLYDKSPTLGNATVSNVIKSAPHKVAMQMLNTIDHSSIYSKYPETGGKLINWGFENPGRKLHKIISSMPKEVYLAILPKMFECNKYVFSHALCSKYTPDNYAVKALKGIAGRKKIPTIELPIATKTLEKLPPVTRLNVVESVLLNCGSNMPFSDLTEDKLRHMLFTAVIRHTNRVEWVVSRFKQLKGN